MSQTRNLFKRISDCGSLCPRCCLLFISPKEERNFSLPVSEALLLINANQTVPYLHDESKLCPCCFGAMTSLDNLAELVVSEIVSRGYEDKTIGLNMTIAPVFDACRVAARTIVTMETEKIAPFPSFNDLFPIILADLIAKKSDLKLVKLADAEVKLDLLGHYGQNGDANILSTVLYPEFKSRKPKRKRGVQNLDPEEQFELTRNDSDKVLISYKNLDDQGINKLRDRLISYVNGTAEVSIVRGSFEEKKTEIEMASAVLDRNQCAPENSVGRKKQKMPDCKKSAVCFDFQKGVCKRGAGCKFCHESISTTENGNNSGSVECEMARQPEHPSNENDGKVWQIASELITAQPATIRWEMLITLCPVYLLGRYRKRARDVPQSPWTVEVDAKISSREEDKEDREVEDVEGDEDGDIKSRDNANNSISNNNSKSNSKITERKGRNSVEEIIGDAVMRTLQCADYKMHSCGREDIDVRVLGNGRPFALEILRPRFRPTAALLQETVDLVQGHKGLNSEGDIELLFLEVSDRSLWEGMQAAAEEKRKAYCCLVWSALPLNHLILQRLEALTPRYSESCGLNSESDRIPTVRNNELSSFPIVVQAPLAEVQGPSISLQSAVDDEGLQCLAIQQKTPLRVLHRRSLLNRRRYIYNLETALLNDHYFLLRLVTSAGTYVKEFVHGDFGRTQPNVSTILGGAADILQLDVTWLYDDFRGGGGSGVKRGVESLPCGIHKAGADALTDDTDAVVAMPTLEDEKRASVAETIIATSIDSYVNQGSLNLESMSWEQMKSLLHTPLKLN